MREKDRRDEASEEGKLWSWGGEELFKGFIKGDSEMEVRRPPFLKLVTHLSFYP